MWREEDLGNQSDAEVPGPRLKFLNNKTVSVCHQPKSEKQGGKVESGWKDGRCRNLKMSSKIRRVMQGRRDA